MLFGLLDCFLSQKNLGYECLMVRVREKLLLLEKYSFYRCEFRNGYSKQSIALWRRWQRQQRRRSFFGGLAVVMEYLVAEVPDNAARNNKKSSINIRLLQLAIHNDEELSKLLNGVTITQGGLIPSLFIYSLNCAIHRLVSTFFAEFSLFNKNIQKYCFLKEKAL